MNQALFNEHLFAAEDIFRAATMLMMVRNISSQKNERRVISENNNS